MRTIAAGTIPPAISAPRPTITELASRCAAAPIPGTRSDILAMQSRYLPFLCLVLLSFMAVTGCLQSSQGAISQTVMSAPQPLTSPVPEAPPRVTAQIWSDENFDRLIEALRGLDSHGLDPDIYNLADLQALWSGDTVYRDREASAAWLRAARDLLLGRTDPIETEPFWNLESRTADLSSHLEQALLTGAIADELEKLAPRSAVYLTMVDKLSKLKAEPPETRNQGEIDTLRVNLERERWMSGYPPGKLLQVNIAAFELLVLEDGEAVARHRTIVGQRSRQTPSFQDQIEFLVFNPWWDVPTSIARRDKFPAFRLNPGSVARDRYQISDRSGDPIDVDSIDWDTAAREGYPFTLRQKPGPRNALGRVKIMFPNPQSVYLHDTPQRDLFEQHVRTFSSGCIRLDKPIDLAEWLLSGAPGWDRKAIDAAVGSGREMRVDLADAIPIRIVYRTALLNEESELV